MQYYNIYVIDEDTGEKQYVRLDVNFTKIKEYATTFGTYEKDKEIIFDNLPDIGEELKTEEV